MNVPQNDLKRHSFQGFTWRGRVVVVTFFLLVIAMMWMTHVFLTERYTAVTRGRSEVRQALYVGNLMSELQRNSIVPILLSRDPVLTGALSSKDFQNTSQHLISYVDEIGAADILLLDVDGRIVAATDRTLLGQNERQSSYFIGALRSNETVFEATKLEHNVFEFTYSHRVDVNGDLAGVIVVVIDLAKFEKSWASISDAVMVANSEGEILLSSQSQWRGRNIKEALAAQENTSAISRALRATGDWSANDDSERRTYFGGEAVMRVENRVPFRGWRIVSLTTYSSVRERVSGFIALEIMALAILLAIFSYFNSRKAMSQAGLLRQESDELRELNSALRHEISERQRAEKNLEVAEQTLAQSSKLAVLGEMSAAVSHELNQPLAAMKTYLAGARLLLQRRLPNEALASFGRIDDLIDRMGAITKQLKSYARKGSDELEVIDLRDCVTSALLMMEPQLKQKSIEILPKIPSDPVMVRADRVRLEQVLVNLLRNAFDACKTVAEPQVEILLSRGSLARVAVLDNGAGIENLDVLFEPFYTTKAPGDGVGLGLAISSGIISELGGRMVARNRDAGGARFEVELPLIDDAIDINDR